MKRLLILAIAVMTMVGATAQTNPMLSPLPMDKEVRYGKLENGMTYYIRHNQKPAGMADFYILHDVGAIQENDDQQGLAHFLEHMAFNGTKNLPDKMLINYLETVGVKFGRNLNAYTSFDQTCYNISDVPTTRQGIIDSALIMLHDWSHFISLEAEEIDAERKVIKEELRTRDGASWRSMLNLLKVLYKDTKYAERNLIGHLDGLESFPHSALREFYLQWYRPDYQAIVIVGDIDVDKVEAQLKTLMSDIPASSAGASKKEQHPVPNNEEPIVSVFADKEMMQSSVSLYIKHQAMPKEYKNTLSGVVYNIATGYISLMSRERLSEIVMSPDAPFTSAYLHIGSVGINPLSEALVMSANVKDGEILKGYEAMTTELEKLQRFGFTQSEFERAQVEIMNSIERTLKTKEDRLNSDFVQTYLNNYSDNTPILEAEEEFKTDSMIVKMLTIEAINGMLKQYITDNNQVIVANVPSKEGVINPTQEEILAVRTKVMNSEVEAYMDDTVKEPLIAEDIVLVGSPVEKESTNETYGTTEWTLENGVKVILKPTTYKSDEVRLSVSSEGGLATLTDDEYHTGEMISDIVAISGISKFSANDLKKQLTGKTVSFQPWTSAYRHGASGFSSPKDLETLLQLTYLGFTAPRYNEDDFNTLMNMAKTQVENMKSNPDYVAYNEYMKTIYGNNLRRQIISAEIIEGLEFAEIQPVFEKLYPGANGFTFTFVGNIDPATLKPLVEKYIGSIPTTAKAIKNTDDNVSVVTGNVDHNFTTAMQQPKVNVNFYLSGEMDYTLENKLALEFLKGALDSRYLVTVREEKGGTYGVNSAVKMDSYPNNKYSLRIVFDTNEEMADELSSLIIPEIEKIAKEGPLSEDIEKTREYLLKNWDDELKQNDNWQKYISEYRVNDIDYITDYKNILLSITNEDVQKLAKQILKDGNLIKMTMRPEATEEVAK